MAALLLSLAVGFLGDWLEARRRAPAPPPAVARYPVRGFGPPTVVSIPRPVPNEKP